MSLPTLTLAAGSRPTEGLSDVGSEVRSMVNAFWLDRDLDEAPRE